MRTKLYIENQLLDLREDENIELNSSIANTSDISSLNTEYVISFTVPATEKNNYIFKHYYDADIDNTFDARTKKNAFITIDGFVFKSGKIGLSKVSVESGFPVNYTLNFRGKGVILKDLFRDDELSSLDLSMYDHDQNGENVKNGLVNGLFGGDVIYNLLVKKQYYFNSDTDVVDTEKLTNISYNGGASIYYADLRPSIRVLSLIERIEDKYNISFSRDFFNRSDFYNLYLWVNNDKELNYFTEKTVQIDFTSKGNIEDYSGFQVNLSENYYVTGTVVSWLDVQITPSVGYENVEYSVVRKLDGQDWTTYTGLRGFNILYFRTDRDDKKHTFFVTSRREFKFTSKLVVKPFSGDIKEATMNEQTIAGGVSSLQSMPKIKISDFIKGLIQMFKLVMIPQDDNTIYVNTISEYYKNGKIQDLTKYVDYKSYDVERGTLNSSISFKFQEPQTILNKQFKINTSIAYGDEQVYLKDENGDLLDGDTLDVTLPFEQIVYERLTDQADDETTNVQYGAIIDDKLDRVNPKPVLFYNNVVELGGYSLGFRDEDNIKTELSTTINTPAHTLGFTNPDFMLTFGLEYDTWNYNGINGTLFYNYWGNYVTDVFNIKRRKFKYKCILPTNILNDLKLNDIIKIKERFYRINDYTVNIMTGEASLSLLNTFETNFGLFQPSADYIQLNYKNQTYSVYVSNAPDSMNIVLENIGYGTSWITATQNDNFIDLTVTENATDTQRNVFVNVDNGSGKSFQIYLNQNRKIVTADSTVVTSDSNLITIDAE